MTIGEKLSGKTVLFYGDSITDCGRRGPERPLGNGYVKMVSDLIAIRAPKATPRILNKGIGGNRVSDLVARLDDDLLRHRPDWISILIGINDLSAYFLKSSQEEAPERVEPRYDLMLTRIRTTLPECKMLIISPFYMSIDRNPNSYRSEILEIIPRYVEISARLAEKHEARIIDLHRAFQERLRFHEAETFCPEPVHPNATGHLLIAEEVYREFEAF